MPFKTVGTTSSGGLEYTPNLPEALVVAVLDSDLEREGRTTAILVNSFIYEHPASGAQILAPQGFITDFASIPAAVRFAFPSFGRHAKAAVLHDWLYAIGEPGCKVFADTVFKDAMEELNVDEGRRNIMYEAVHLFGGESYARAEGDWNGSWGDWRKGVRIKPPGPRSEYYRSHWPKPPK